MSTSSKTPSSATAKTGSAPKFFLVAGAVLLASILAVVAGVMGLEGRAAGETTLHGGKHRYVLEVASTAEAQGKGLGGRASMPRGEGMLFRFPETETRCFWMKDMRFSLDIIWLDSAKRVVHVERSVSPATYPRNFCFKAQYVIELNAGQARAAGIRTGQTLTF